MKLNYLLCLGLLSLSAPAFSQENEQKKDEGDMYTLSLEELMNIPIKSASKKEETLFDAPLSSYTITRAEIDRAGSTSIMEALRLSPGLIVREQANGMYDIHIRGLENLTQTNGTFLKANSLTLVMIDNRPVFNHGLGGTYWESIPVDLNDVERIEIVRGPSSPLFGPNAVTGVINIITRRVGEKGNLVSANVQAGTLGTSTANVSLGKTITEKFSVLVTANFQNRHRVDEDYYQQGTGSYVPLSTLMPDPTSRNSQYPNPDISLKRYGVNGYLTYRASENTTIDLSLSTQAADFQKIFIQNPLTGGNTNNSAANLSIKSGDLKIRSSYLSGFNSDLNTGLPLTQTGTPLAQYDYTVGDINAEYDINFGKKYTLTPGLSYQSVTFDDTKYINLADGNIGLFNAKNTITTAAAFLRSDLNFTDKLRVIAGLRGDKFSAPDKAYLAYEFLATYKLSPKNLIRAAITRSNSGSFMGYNYVNIGGGQIGDNNLKLLTVDMIELGFRSKLSNNLQLDVDIFQQQAKNLTAIVQTAGPQQFSNVPTTAKQIGTTISINFVASEKIQFKPFVTLQKTETKDLPSIYLDPSVIPGAVTYSNMTHKYTPGTYGGFYFNYRPVAKFNVNINSYFYGKQTQYDGSATVSGTPQYGYSQVASKVIVSAKVSYEVTKGLNLYINARNALGTSTREFYAADRTAGLYTFGASFNLN